MKLNKYICIILSSLLIFAVLPIAAFADTTDTNAVNAEIMTVYGGADGIISMTFDDGYYETTLVLDELFTKYDLKGSIMMIGENAATTAGKFQAIFDGGRLEPQSHSMSHANLTDASVPSESRDEVLSYEIVESKAQLSALFPSDDIITFAIPYGGMSDAAYDLAAEHYYAIRTTRRGVQSLDPGFSREYGSWSMMYSPATYQSNYANLDDPETVQWEAIKGAIDSAANGWYIPITHRVGDVQDTDLTYAMADKMFAYIAQLKNEGKVWVTTYSEAVKYVRERQNSTVHAYTEGGSIYVDVTMAAVTEDGLALSADVFNTPLTVKVEVPAEYGTIYYTIAEREYTAEAFSDGSKNYAYVNVAPNAGPVKLRVSSTHEFGEWNKYTEELHKRNCTDCGLADFGEHTWDEGEITKAPTHLKVGSKICNCIYCSEDSTQTVKKTDDHTFSEKVESMQFKASSPTCTTGALYYYSCRCGASGTETYEVGDPLGHSFGEWHTDISPTKTTDGRSVRECTCGEVEYTAIPATGEDEGGISTPLLIGIIGGGVALVAVGVAVAVIVIKKKKKA